MYLLYSALLAAWLLLGTPYWLYQMVRHGKYRAGLGERLGAVPARLGKLSAQPLIWVHAVSVGEVQAVSHLVTELRHAFPAHRIVVSTTTATGQELARQRFGEENVFYFPLDFVFAIRPWLRALRPQAVVVAETEFWPNFLRLARARGARIAVVNARISDRSLPGYRRLRRWLVPVLRNVDLFLAQGAQDRQRLEWIGAAPERVAVSGNLKFDVAPPQPPPLVAQLRSAFERAGAGPVLVCGSTMPGEEPLLLRAFEIVLSRYPRAVMILAPRHPERFQQVAALTASLGLTLWRRSQWNGSDPLAGGVLLLDTMGELSAVYALARIAFVGGSLVPRGGHNILEPAQHGAAILVGPSTENFRDMVEQFRQADALRVVGPAELPLTLLELLQDEAARAALGRRAAEVLRSFTGATQRTLAALQKLISQANHSAPPLPAGTLAGASAAVPPNAGASPASTP